MNFAIQAKLWRIRTVYAFVLIAGIQGLAMSEVDSANLKPHSCPTPEHRNFDFWIGDWDVFDVGGSAKVAYARVDRILEDCVIREQYAGIDGHKGQSLSSYDASTKIWRQNWVTNRGENLIIEGTFQNGEIVLSGKDQTKGVLTRTIWKPTSEGVRETAMMSSDNGKVWKPGFDLIFRPAAISDDTPVTDHRDEEKIIMALDTEYQAAVQKNDAATMDRLLDDNFILVTGRGKTYRKSDLLEDARSGRVHYERQDDSEQTVRIWGNTAVITAKLREKSVNDGKPFDYTLWFSDTYVHSKAGWKYVFGQASLPLPAQ